MRKDRKSYEKDLTRTKMCVILRTQARTNKCVLKLYHNRRTKKCVKRRGVDE